MTDESPSLQPDATRFCPECGEEYDEDVRKCPEDGARLHSLGLSETTDVDPLLGETLDDRFRIDTVLGEGGMGRVYEGLQLSVERPVAIKTLRPELDSEEVVVKRFFREARAISKFSHPNIVNLVDFGKEERKEVLYLAMELIEGVPLEDLLDDHRLRPELAVYLVRQLCEALAAAHARDIVHRDLKPENIILVVLADGRVEAKLVDFGIAHAVQGQTQLTQTGAVCGTPYYMAPEQTRGKDVGPHTDVYALGVMFFEMLTGHRPVSAEQSMEIMLTHARGDLPKLHEFVDPEELPDGLASLVDDMLEHDIEDRIGEVVEVRDRLRAISRRENYEAIYVDPEAETSEQFAEWLAPEAPRRDTVRGELSTDAAAAAPETGERAIADAGRKDYDSEAVAETVAANGEAGASRGTSPRTKRGNRSSTPESRDDTPNRGEVTEHPATGRTDADRSSSPYSTLLGGVGVLLLLALGAGGAILAMGPDTERSSETSGPGSTDRASPTEQAATGTDSSSHEPSAPTRSDARSDTRASRDGAARIERDTRSQPPSPSVEPRADETTPDDSVVQETEGGARSDDEQTRAGTSANEARGASSDREPSAGSGTRSAAEEPPTNSGASDSKTGSGPSAADDEEFSSDTESSTPSKEPSAPERDREPSSSSESQSDGGESTGDRSDSGGDGRPSEETSDDSSDEPNLFPVE